MFARLKDWRRVATRYDRCAHTFMSAIVIAATMLFWINEMGWLPPSQTASLYAKKVVLKALRAMPDQIEPFRCNLIGAKLL